MAAKSKCFGVFSYSFCISALFFACLSYIYINWVLEINNCLKIKNEDESKWREYLNWFTTTEETDSCNVWLLKTHQNAFSKTFQHYAEASGFTAREAYLSLLFGTLVVSILAVLACLCCRKKKTIPIISLPVSPEIKKFTENIQIVSRNSKNHFDIRKFVLVLFFTTLALSVPWEFVRLYQREISKRAASTSLGAPLECHERSTSLLQSIKLFLQWQFSWSHLDQCENYYYHLLVDPLWELTPLLVISSALTRCLLHPIELFFSGLGRGFRAFFVEIPAQWQPVLLVVLTFILLAVILMTFSYKLHIPLLFKIEPKTPVYIQDCSHKNTNHNNPYIQNTELTNRNGSYISSPNQNCAHNHNGGLTNSIVSYNSSPNQKSSYMHSEKTANRNGSNIYFSLHDVPRSPNFKSSEIFYNCENSTSDFTVEANVLNKRKYTKKSKDTTESRKGGNSTPKKKSTRSRCRKNRYDDDPDFDDDL